MQVAESKSQGSGNTGKGADLTPIIINQLIHMVGGHTSSDETILPNSSFGTWSRDV